LPIHGLIIQAIEKEGEKLSKKAKQSTNIKLSLLFEYFF
jgi:hypothetical protein